VPIVSNFLSGGGVSVKNSEIMAFEDAIAEHIAKDSYLYAC